MCYSLNVALAKGKDVLVGTCMGYFVSANRAFIRMGAEDCPVSLDFLGVEEVKRVDVVRKTLQDLPEENYHVLRVLTAFLVQVSTSLSICLS